MVYTWCNLSEYSLCVFPWRIVIMVNHKSVQDTQYKRSTEIYLMTCYKPTPHHPIIPGFYQIDKLFYVMYLFFLTLWHFIKKLNQVEKPQGNPDSYCRSARCYVSDVMTRIVGPDEKYIDTCVNKPQKQRGRGLMIFNGSHTKYPPPPSYSSIHVSGLLLFMDLGFILLGNFFSELDVLLSV